MNLSRERSEQIPLFDLHPDGSEPPIARRVITEGCLLPWPSNVVVDVKRASEIFDVSQSSVMTMLKTGVLDGYQLSPSMRWNTSYGSIVEFCDRLRIKFAIADRRPKLPAGRRWRDADLLPFPKSDTVIVKDVMTGLEVTRDLALKLIEEGAFEAYCLFLHAPWRVSKTSLYAYRDRLRAQAASGGYRGRPARRSAKR
jgi:hypothetical protein